MSAAVRWGATAKENVSRSDGKGMPRGETSRAATHSDAQGALPHTAAAPRGQRELQPWPLCSDRYRNGEPLKPTRRATCGLMQCSCVIRRKAATDSDAIRPPIPTEVGHPFRSKPATLVRPV